MLDGAEVVDSPPSHQQQLAATGQLPPVVIKSITTGGNLEDDSKAPHKLDEVEIVRRAMVNTMRLFDANEFKSDPDLFKQTVLETLEIVRAQHRAEGEPALLTARAEDEPDCPADCPSGE